jgi:hypothetical protein
MIELVKGDPSFRMAERFSSLKTIASMRTMAQ